ncbi:MAG TPA: type II toxin-antitoxin system RelE/ParE family toxin [Phycisphaerae bacterium]|nr:type II toxin-antitoxin system RelE/ParE family toxin [Phycisphaerae bacterium]
MNLRIRPAAQAEIDDLAEYIALDNESAARRFLAAVNEAFESLLRMPGMGCKREFIRNELRQIRSWPVPGFNNYLIFYREVLGGIEVLHVFHGARDLDAIFKIE